MNNSAMTGPIIPADQWPEWADRHCWDADGDGYFYGVVRSTSTWWWRTETEPSGIPIPSGHDWRVPVMRHQPVPAIDLARVRASARSLLNWIDDWAETPGESGIEAIAEEAEAVLALIDGQSVSEKPQKRRCPNNAAPGGCQLPNRFCTFPDCEKADKLLPSKGEDEG